MTRVTPTAQHRRWCISHLPPIPHNTTHHKTSIVARVPDNAIGKRDEQRAPYAFLDTCTLRGGAVEDRRRVIAPFPFRRHKNPVNKDSTSNESTASSISQHTTRDVRTSTVFPRSSRNSRPSKRRNRSSCPVLFAELKRTREPKRVGGCRRGQHCLQHNAGDVRQCSAESQ